MSLKYLVMLESYQTSNCGKKLTLASFNFNDVLIRATLKAVGCATVKMMRKAVWKVLFVITPLIQHLFMHNSR